MPFVKHNSIHFAERCMQYSHAKTDCSAPEEAASCAQKKTCLHCGHTFLVYPKRNCLICGKTFEPRRKNQGLCYDKNCRKIYQSKRVNTKEYYKKNKEKMKEMISLYGSYKTSKVPPVVRKFNALKRALKKGNLTEDVLRKISEGKTHEAYL